MTQPAAEIVELAIAACSTCDMLFLVSPRRGSCPTCGGEPGLVFFEFVGDQAGLHLKPAESADLPPAAAAPPFGALEAAAEPEPLSAAAPALAPSPVAAAAPGIPSQDVGSRPPAPAAPTVTPGAAETVVPVPPSGGTAENYLRRVVDLTDLIDEQLEEDEPDWVPLRAAMGALGAEHEEISTAIGRLEAVRNLIYDLAARGLGDVQPVGAEAPSLPQEET